MNATRDVQAVLTYPGHADTEATLHEQVWTNAQRLQRSAKALGLTWAAAIAAVFLPLLHFLLNGYGWQP